MEHLEKYKRDKQKYKVHHNGMKKDFHPIHIVDVDRIINSKIDNVSKNIINRYKISNENIYEEVYLRVRKMFLEMM